MKVQEGQSQNHRLRHERINSLKTFEYFDKSKMALLRGGRNNVDLGPQERAAQNYLSHTAATVEQSRKLNSASYK